MNILITGINGFIGRHAGRMLSEKYQVFGLTRSNAFSILNPNVKLVRADLSDPDFVYSLPTEIDCVIHFAQSQRYRDFPEGAADMLNINIDATYKLLDWARKTSVKQFIFTSTANVYSESKALLTESHATRPNSFYGASKLAAEQLINQYFSYFQVDILRLFTVYGPTQKGMLIPNIIERIKTRFPITLAQGEGLFLTPIYVDEVVTAIEKLMNTPLKNSVRMHNVCGNKVIHLGEIVSALEDILGIKANVEFVNEKPQFFTGTNDALLQCIGPLNFTDLATGLATVVNNKSR